MLTKILAKSPLVIFANTLTTIQDLRFKILSVVTLIKILATIPLVTVTKILTKISAVILTKLLAKILLVNLTKIVTKTP